MTIERIRELIKKYEIFLTQQNGQDALKLRVPKSEKDINEIKAGKYEIIAELKRQEEERQQRREELKQIAEQRKAEQDTIDKPLLEEMYKKADELRSQIPADHIEVTAEQTGDLDGDPIMQYTVEGIKLHWQDVNHIGWASAIRPGALGSFAKILICSISKEKLEQIKTAQMEAKNQQEKIEQTENERITAIFEKAKQTGEKQYLNHYTADCNDQNEDCSTDIVTIWAMPDGTKTITRQHTW
jgi:hypothetical protein